MTIRKAKEDDSKSVFEFICELEETTFDYPVFERYYLANLENKDNIHLVAVSESDEVIGYISCHGQVLLHHLSKVFEIQELFVKEEYRNQNIGLRLVEALEEYLRKNGYKSLEVTANVKRKATHKFYSKCGFQQTHLKFTKILM